MYTTTTGQDSGVFSLLKFVLPYTPKNNKEEESLSFACAFSFSAQRVTSTFDANGIEVVSTRIGFDSETATGASLACWVRMRLQWRLDCAISDDS